MIDTVLVYKKGNYIIPFAYANHADEYAESVFDLACNVNKQNEYALYWTVIPEAIENPNLSNHLLPIICRKSGDFIEPYMTILFDDGIQVTQYDDLESLIAILNNVNKTFANKVTHDMIVDYNELLQGSMLSYTASMIRDGSVLNDIESTKKITNRLQKLMEECNDFDSYSKELEIAKTQLKKFEDEIAKQKEVQENQEKANKPVFVPSPQVEAEIVEEQPKEEIKQNQQAPTPQSSISSTKGQTSSAETQQKKEEQSSLSNQQTPTEDYENTKPSAIEQVQSFGGQESAEELAGKMREQIEAAKKEIETNKQIETGSSEDTELNDEQNDEEVIVQSSHSDDFILDYSGSPTVIFEGKPYTDDELKTLKQIKILTDYNVPVFIPKTVKYETPIGYNCNEKGSVLAGMEYDDFFEQVKMYTSMDDERLGDIPGLREFGEEICAILKLDTLGISFRNLIPLFPISDVSGGTRHLYEMLKYHTEGTSFNGLYENLYYFIFIFKTEIDYSFSNKSFKTDKEREREEVTMNYKLADALATLACDFQGFEYTEEVVKKKKSDEDDDGDPETIITAVLDRETVQKANSTMKNIILNTILGTTKIAVDIPDEPSLQSIKKVCILGRYMLPFNIKHTTLAEQGFTNLKVCIQEYGLYLRYFGIEIDPTALGLSICEYTDILNAREDPESDISKLDKQHYEQLRLDTLEENSYNNSLSILKGVEFMKFVSARTRKSYALEIPKNLSGYTLEKTVIGSYKPEGADKAKPILLGYILAYSGEDATQLNRYQFFPVISSVFDEMLQMNMQIENVIDNNEMKPIPFDSVKSAHDGVLYESYKLKLYRDKSKFIVFQVDQSYASAHAISLLIRKNATKMGLLKYKQLYLPSWAVSDPTVDMGYKKLFQV